MHEAWRGGFTPPTMDDHHAKSAVPPPCPVADPVAFRLRPGGLRATPLAPGPRATCASRTTRPGKGCAFLGDVTGSQGDFLRGAITSNADLETGARNDLKNRAAAMGGNVVYLLTQRAGQTGRKDHSEQTNVTLTGNVYRCE